MEAHASDSDTTQKSSQVYIYKYSDGTTIFRNVGSYSPTNTASHPKRHVSSVPSPRGKRRSFQSCYCAGGHSLREMQRLAYTIRLWVKSHPGYLVKCLINVINWCLWQERCQIYIKRRDPKTEQCASECSNRTYREQKHWNGGAKQQCKYQTMYFSRLCDTTTIENTVAGRYFIWQLSAVLLCYYRPLNTQNCTFLLLSPTEHTKLYFCVTIAHWTHKSVLLCYRRPLNTQNCTVVLLSPTEHTKVYFCVTIAHWTQTVMLC
jgi:hypothetical protein